MLMVSVSGTAVTIDWMVYLYKRTPDAEKLSW
jgi:hypothetical protein